MTLGGYRQIFPCLDDMDIRVAATTHDGLPEGTGLISAPSNAIHTFFMRFAIDAAFVSKDGRVLKVRAAMPPCRIAAAWGGFAVIELPAGALERADTQRGDTFRIGAN